jgi:PTH1 family peptidyl-tRNA hydrolase
MLVLIVFLGNPGAQYTRNRHNAGRLLAEALPCFSALTWQAKFKGRYAILDKIHFLAPETYMNLSGEAVQAAAAFFKLKAEQILVVHDELELPLGVASFKFGGGLGGHNGLRSVNACLNTPDFWRLRIGIGRPNHSDIASWVLSDFSAADAPLLEHTLSAAAAALTQALRDGPASLLPAWNKKRCVDTA